MQPLCWPSAVSASGHHLLEVSNAVWISSLDQHAGIATADHVPLLPGTTEGCVLHSGHPVRQGHLANREKADLTRAERRGIQPLLHKDNRASKGPYSQHHQQARQHCPCKYTKNSQPRQIENKLKAVSLLECDRSRHTMCEPHHVCSMKPSMKLCQDTTPGPVADDF